MGPEGRDEDPHQGARPRPKLTLAGRLEGTAAGQSVTIDAAGNKVTVALPLLSLVSSRGLWRAMRPSLEPLLSRLGLRLLARAGWLGDLEVSPSPSFLVRLLLPRS